MGVFVQSMRLFLCSFRSLCPLPFLGAHALFLPFCQIFERLLSCLVHWISKERHSLPTSEKYQPDNLRMRPRYLPFHPLRATSLLGAGRELRTRHGPRSHGAHVLLGQVFGNTTHVTAARDGDKTHLGV